MLVYRVTTDTGLYLKLRWDEGRGQVVGHEWTADKGEATWWRRRAPEIVYWLEVAGALPEGADQCYLKCENETAPASPPGD